MKRLSRIAALILILIFVFCQTCFGEITLISPVNNSIVYRGDFYISIKLTKNPRLKVQLYQVQIYHIGLIEKELIISGRELSDAQGNPVTSLKYKVQGKIYEKYKDVDELQEDDLKLLASVKNKETSTGINLSNGQDISYLSETEYGDAEEYVISGSIGLYTCNFEGLESGIYRIQADEINDNGKVVGSESYYIVVKDSDGTNQSEDEGGETPNLEDDDPVVIPDEEKEPTLFDKIISFLKSIFK